MIDLHCHILAGFDDGPADQEESLAMCRQASADGIRTIVATPHYKPGSYEWKMDALFLAVCGLQSAVTSAGINLTILPGAEAALFPELPDLLREKNFLTINSGCYFMVECTPHSVPANAGQFLLSLMDGGVVPVIAHPERCDLFFSQPELLSHLVAKGALLQLTAGSITGQFGPQVRDFSLILIKKGLAHIIASDAHDVSQRPPRLAEAVSLVADLVGHQRAQAMVNSSPAAVVASRPLRFPLPAERREQHPVRPASWFRRILGAAA